MTKQKGQAEIAKAEVLAKETTLSPSTSTNNQLVKYELTPLIMMTIIMTKMKWTTIYYNQLIIYYNHDDCNNDPN